MGGLLSGPCCFEDGALPSQDMHERKRTEALMAGVECTQQFKFSSSKVALRLSEDEAQFSWRTLGGASIKHSSVAVDDVERVEARGESGVRYVVSREIVDFILADAGARDAWITASNEVLARRKCVAAAAKRDRAYDAERESREDAIKAKWEKKKDDLEKRREGRLSMRAQYEGAGTEYTDSAKKRRAAAI